MGLQPKRATTTAEAESVHENFSTASLGERIRKRVRQDRHRIDHWPCAVIINGERFEVINYSSFGLAIRTKDLPEFPGGELLDIPLILEQTEVARFNLRIARHQDHAEGGKITAFEITGDPLDTTRLQALMQAKQMIREENERLRGTDQVPQAFKKQVYEIKDILEELEEKVNGLQNTAAFSNAYDLTSFENAVIEVVADHLQQLFEPAYESLSDSMGTLNEDQMKASFEFFRNQLRHLIYLSPFSERSYKKPLGYAGDYEMMNLLYRNENLGKNLFAKSLHRYYMEHPNAKAVRNRAVYLHKRLFSLLSTTTDRPETRILSVASGPAKEIQKISQDNLNFDKVEFHLLDQDLSALRDAQRDIRTACRKENKDIRVRYLHKAIRDILKQGLDDTYHMVYSAGLFDYFSDPVAQMAARRLYQMLEPGGQLIIGNFTAATRRKMLMDLALDWNLIYRTERDLKNLYQEFGNKMTIESEPEEVNLFVVITK